MKKILHIIVFLIVNDLYSQQLPQYTQYTINDFVVNPAIAGTLPYYTAKANYRYQWEGITDAPRTYILSVHGPLKSSMKIGIGGYVFTDFVGPTRRTGIYGTYAYHLQLKENLKLSLSLAFGALQFMIDGSKITLRVPGDYILTNGVQSTVLFDAGFGFYLYHPKYYIGGSFPQLLRNRIKFFKFGENPTARLADHYFLHGGYKFFIGDKFKIEPSALIKYVKPVPVQVELTLRAFYNDFIWLGTSFRSEDSFSALIGFTLQHNLFFGYSYDFLSSNLKNYSSGSHELMIGVRFLQKEKTAVPSMQ